MTEPITRIKLRRGVTAAWAAANTILAAGEAGVQLAATAGQRARWKIGDGVTAWDDLPWQEFDASAPLTLTDTLTVADVAGVETINGRDVSADYATLDATKVARGQLAVYPWSLVKPTNFPVTPEITPVRTARGWRGSVSARSLRPAITGTTYYVDVVLGNNANAGTEAAPLKSVWSALQKADVGLVKVAPGLYGFEDTWKAPTYAIAVDASYGVERWACRPGEVVLHTGYSAPTWTVNGTYATVFDATLAFVHGVTDIGVRLPNGAYLDYVAAASLAQCSTIRGSYFYDGTTLSVHPLRVGAPDARVLPLRNVQGALDSSRRSVWMSDLTFVGGSQGILVQNTTGTDGGRLIARRVKVCNATNDGIQTKGTARVILEDCEVYGCRGDGITHQEQATTLPRQIVEVRCISAGHGSTETADTMNGFTSHANMHVLRIGCKGGTSRGPSFADVNSGNRVWMVGCEAWHSASEDDDTQNTGFTFSNGSNAWLYDCESSGSLWDLVVGASSEVYLDECVCSVQSVAGTLGTHTQL